MNVSINVPPGTVEDLSVGELGVLLKMVGVDDAKLVASRALVAQLVGYREDKVDVILRRLEGKGYYRAETVPSNKTGNGSQQVGYTTLTADDFSEAEAKYVRRERDFSSLEVETEKIGQMASTCDHMLNRITAQQELFWQIGDEHSEHMKHHPLPDHPVHYQIDKWFWEVTPTLTSQMVNLTRKIMTTEGPISQVVEFSLHISPTGHCCIKPKRTGFSWSDIQWSKILDKAFCNSDRARFLWEKIGSRNPGYCKELLLNVECPEDIRAEIIAATEQ